METEQIVGLVIALVVMAVGFIGCFMPALPGTPLILAAAIGHKLYFKETGVGWFIMTLLVGITLLSIVVDYLASMIGAKSFGATKKGMAGAIVGAIVGLFFSLPGILLGPLIGAAAFEMIGRRPWPEAFRAGIGATVGLFAGALGKLACCIVMMGLFVANVAWRSVN